MKKSILGVVLICLACLSQAQAVSHYCVEGAARRTSPRAQFVKAHPCPLYSAATRRCMVIVDHIKPLCRGGADRPSNMAWQSRAQSYSKDRWELCGGWLGHMRECVRAGDCFISPVVEVGEGMFGLGVN